MRLTRKFSPANNGVALGVSNVIKLFDLKLTHIGQNFLRSIISKIFTIKIFRNRHHFGIAKKGLADWPRRENITGQGCDLCLFEGLD